MYKAPMVAPLFEALTVALALSDRTAERRIVHPLTAVRFMGVQFMAARSTGHGSRHPITARLSRA
jgi:hypothetical protein